MAFSWQARPRRARRRACNLRGACRVVEHGGCIGRSEDRRRDARGFRKCDLSAGLHVPPITRGHSGRNRLKPNGKSFGSALRFGDRTCGHRAIMTTADTGHQTSPTHQSCVCVGILVRFLCCVGNSYISVASGSSTSSARCRTRRDPCRAANASRNASRRSRSRRRAGLY